MANIVKKGYLEVKKRGRLAVGSPYKPKFVILRCNTAEGSKVVEIRDKDGENDVEYLPLNGMWTVQDKMSKKSKRFAFELVIGSEVAMTFACNSITEREDWTESFRILNKVSPCSTPIAEDMFVVFLERSLSAVEVGVSGPCLLSIQDSSIVLYSRCGQTKLHHWSAANVRKMEIVNEQVVLVANRAGSDVPMEFRFNTETETAKLILTTWSMVFMQNLTARDPEKLNKISKFLLSQGGVGSTIGKGSLLEDGSGGVATRSSKVLSGGLPTSTKQGKANESTEEWPVVRRAQSFNSKLSMNVRRSISPVGSSRLSVTSQGSSYTINAPHMSISDEEQSSPPPIPPRVIRPFSGGFDSSSDAREDPDYSYIKDDELEGKLAEGSGGLEPSNSFVDRQLDDLLFDIIKDNERKKQKDKKVPSFSEQVSPTKPRTLGPPVHVDFLVKTREYFGQFQDQQPSDYLEPVPTKKMSPPVMVSHAHSLSLPATMSTDSDLQHLHHSPSDLQQLHHSPSDLQRLKQPLTNQSSNPYSTIPDKPSQQSHPVIGTDMYPSQLPPELPPRMPRRSQSSSDDTSSPPLPPRSSRLSVESEKFPFSPTKILRPKSYTDSRSMDITPYATTKNFQIDTGRQKSPGSTPGRLSPRNSSPPPLPPRSPVKRTRERSSSSSSNSSMLVTRCPKCNGRKSSAKQPVSKTMSLNDHRHHHHHHHHHHNHHRHSNHPNYAASSLDGSGGSDEGKMDEASGSLPDLHKTSPIPENRLSQKVEKRDDSGSSSQSSIETGGGGGHASVSSISSPRSAQLQEMPTSRPAQPVQPTSPLSPPPYLQVLDEDQPPAKNGTTSSPLKPRSELDSALEVLSTCVKDLQTLESRVTNHNGTTRGRVVTDLDVAIRQAMTVRDDLQLAMKDSKKAPTTKDDRLHRSATVSQRDYYLHSNGVPPGSKSRTMSLPRSPASSPRLHKRSSAFGFSAPPIPPRSMVSLKSSPDMMTSSPNHPLQRLDSTGSVYGNRKMCSPNHSLRHIEPMDVANRNKKKLVHRHTSHLIPVNDLSPGSQGSTVFVHHIKDIRNPQF